MTVNHGLLYALGEIGWVGIMPEFAYKARNAQGGLVEGVLNCPDRGVAIRQIEQQNCIPIRIDPVMTTAPATAVPTGSMRMGMQFCCSIWRMAKLHSHSH